MKSQLTIPNKIKVGYQHRTDTYTKRLAYIIYYDNKGVLRKEGSWLGWIHNKEKNSGYDEIKREWTNDLPPIPVDEFDNVPTEGFVLNKGVGGAGYGWHGRQAKIRVYDPRNFEFEITIENLLFILAHTSSIRGKGIEGEMIYSWDGKDLVLLPADCPEYKESMIFTSIQTNKISAKELISGCSYQTKKQENLIYLGKLDWHSFNNIKNFNRKTYNSRNGGSYLENGYYDKNVNLDKYSVYVDDKEEFVITEANKLALLNSNVPVSNYADLMDKYYNSMQGTKVVGLEIALIDNDYFKINDDENNSYRYSSDEVYLEISPNVYKSLTMTKEKTYNREFSRYELVGYKFTESAIISFEDGKLTAKGIQTDNYNSLFYRKSQDMWRGDRIEQKILSIDECIKFNFKKLLVVLESGKKITYNNYH